MRSSYSFNSLYVGIIVYILQLVSSFRRYSSRPQRQLLVLQRLFQAERSLLRLDLSDHLLLLLLAERSLSRLAQSLNTFKVEQNVGLVVLEHLGNELRVHVLDVDLLEILVQHHDSLVQFFLQFGVSWAHLDVVYIGLPLTTLTMIRESRRLCWCSWGLSCSYISDLYLHARVSSSCTMAECDVRGGVGGRDQNS